MMRRVVQDKQWILHVGSRAMIVELRDRILRLHGFEVISTRTIEDALALFQARPFDLVLIDVEGEGRVPLAERLCEGIRELQPEQKVGFVCNYLVSIKSDCPDEIIEAEFNPAGFVDGVVGMLE
jgi:DNA-binding NtrC family response regulator